MPDPNIASVERTTSAKDITETPYDWVLECLKENVDQAAIASLIQGALDQFDQVKPSQEALRELIGYAKATHLESPELRWELVKKVMAKSGTALCDDILLSKIISHNQFNEPEWRDQLKNLALSRFAQERSFNTAIDSWLQEIAKWRLAKELPDVAKKTQSFSGEEEAWLLEEVVVVGNTDQNEEQVRTLEGLERDFAEAEAKLKQSMGLVTWDNALYYGLQGLDLAMTLSGSGYGIYEHCVHAGPYVGGVGNAAAFVVPTDVLVALLIAVPFTFNYGFFSNQTVGLPKFLTRFQPWDRREHYADAVLETFRDMLQSLEKGIQSIEDQGRSNHLQYRFNHLAAQFHAANALYLARSAQKYLKTSLTGWSLRGKAEAEWLLAQERRSRGRVKAGWSNVYRLRAEAIASRVQLPEYLNRGTITAVVSQLSQNHEESNEAHRRDVNLVDLEETADILEASLRLRSLKVELEKKQAKEVLDENQKKLTSTMLSGFDIVAFELEESASQIAQNRLHGYQQTSTFEWVNSRRSAFAA
jgi:hypothetical protein